jgi:hypothetical protein
MNKYEIKYKGNKYYHYGEDAFEAMDKFANRKVFGQNLIFDYTVKMFDADTQGEDWLQVITKGDDNPQTILVSKC